MTSTERAEKLLRDIAADNTNPARQIIAKAFEQAEADVRAEIVDDKGKLQSACKMALTELVYLAEQMKSREGGSVHRAIQSCQDALAGKPSPPEEWVETQYGGLRIGAHFMVVNQRRHWCTIGPNCASFNNKYGDEVSLGQLAKSVSKGFHVACDSSGQPLPNPKDGYRPAKVATEPKAEAPRFNAGDRVKGLINNRSGDFVKVLNEELAKVIWDDGSYECVSMKDIELLPASPPKQTRGEVVAGQKWGVTTYRSNAEGKSQLAALIDAERADAANIVLGECRDLELRNRKLEQVKYGVRPWPSRSRNFCAF